MELAGFVDDSTLPLDPDVAHVPVLPERDGFDAAPHGAPAASRLVVAFSSRSSSEILGRSARRLRPAAGFDRAALGVPLTALHPVEVNGIAVVDLKSARLSRGARVVKRTMDLVISVGA